VATIDYTNEGGGKSEARATDVDIHAFSTYVCDTDKSCSPNIWVSDSSSDVTGLTFYDTCFQDCPVAGAYAGVADDEFHSISCYPKKCCDYII